MLIPETRVVKPEDVKIFLDKKFEQYNNPSFIETDPVQIPHQFTRDEDIEIAAFLTATIAWGRRSSIIKSGYEMIRRMNENPYHFIMHSNDEDFSTFLDYKYRIFNGIDMISYLTSLKNIYENMGGLRGLFMGISDTSKNLAERIIDARKRFFEVPCPDRTGKHFPDISRGASAKRINLFLKWMIRKDNRGVDFGIWNDIPASELYIPLDVHTGNVARKLGLLKRKQNDWKAVEELTAVLRQFDPEDPVKYDYALFGLGVFEGF